MLLFIHALLKIKLFVFLFFVFHSVGQDQTCENKIKGSSVFLLRMPFSLFGFERT